MTALHFSIVLLSGVIVFGALLLLGAMRFLPDKNEKRLVGILVVSLVASVAIMTYRGWAWADKQVDEGPETNFWGIIVAPSDGGVDKCEGGDR